MSRMVEVDYTRENGEKRHHSIPDIWLASFCTKSGCTVQDAIRWWDQQQQMEEAAA